MGSKEHEEANHTCVGAAAARGRGSIPGGSGEETATAGVEVAPEPARSDDADLAALATEERPGDWAHFVEVAEHTRMNFDSSGDALINSITSSCSHASGGMRVPHNKQSGGLR